MVEVDVADGAGRAGFRAPGVTPAEIALDNLPRGLVVVHRSERTGDGAILAAYAAILNDLLGTRGGVDDDSFDRAGVQTPGLLTLRTGVGREASFIVEAEYLDSRPGWIENAFVFIRTGEFTLQTAGAFLGFEVERS
jgi:hypothetical protein